MENNKKILIKYNKNNHEDLYISLKDIKKEYDKNTKVLKNVNLDIKKGERIAILGHNGSGKTTLVEIISRIKAPTSGKIIYNHFQSQEEFGREVAIQFQKLVYPEGYKVNEIIPFFNNMVEKHKRFSKDKLTELVKLFGINKFYHKSLISLSGGQQQRINLFLVYIKQPSLIILDELSTGLDIEIYERILNLFNDYTAKNNVTLILVSHNLEEIKRLTERSYFLREGEITFCLPTEKLTGELFFEFIRRNERDLSKYFDFTFNVTEDKNSLFNNLYYFYAFIRHVQFKKIEQIKHKILTLNQKLKKMIDEEPKIFKNQNQKTEHMNKLHQLIFEQETQLADLLLNNSVSDEKHTKTNNEINTQKILELKKNLKIREKEAKKLENSVKKLIKNNSNFESKIETKESKIDLLSNLLLKKHQKLITKKYDKITKCEHSIYKLYEDFTNISEIELADLKNNMELLIKDLVLLENEEESLKIFFDGLVKYNYSLDDFLVIKNLKKYYGIVPVINGINLKIKKGSRVAITGPNGAGKTTLTEIIATTLNKTTGKILYWFSLNKYEAKHKIGMQFQESSFPSDLKVEEIIKLFFHSSKFKINWDELQKLIDIFKLKHVLKHSGDKLSGGEKQRLNILISLLKKPELIILDEISAGLDVESIMDINIYIDNYLKKTNSTLILISHNPYEIKKLANTLFILKEGKIIGKKDVKKMSIKELREDFKSIYQKNYGFISNIEANVKNKSEGFNVALE